MLSGYSFAKYIKIRIVTIFLNFATVAKILLHFQNIVTRIVFKRKMGSVIAQTKKSEKDEEESSKQ